MTITFQFRIDAMDCAEEVTLLKKALRKHVPSDDSLHFDLLNAKLSISVEKDTVTEEALLEAIATTGLKAKTWQAHISNPNQPSWQRFIRPGLVIISTALLLIGTCLHISLHGYADALLGDHTSTQTIPLAVATLYIISILCSAWFVLPKAWSALKRLQPDINLLMIIAVIGALLIQQWIEAAMVTLLFAIAQLLESWSVGKARQAVKALLAITPDIAHVRTCCGNLKDSLVEDIAIDTTIIIRPGEKVPLDAIITDGKSHIDQATITGESQPITKTIGDSIYAGTLNNEGVITARVTQRSDNTLFAQTIRQVEQAQANRARSEQWVEKFAKYYTPAMMLLAALVMLIPPVLTNAAWLPWVYEGLVILVIACPCALVISTPVSIIAGLSTAARAGVLIKGGNHLEALAQLKAIAFDKTGTITQGKPTLEKVITQSELSSEQLIQLAASLEAQSNHPLALAITQAAKKNNLPMLQVANVKSIKGKGLTGTINNQTYWIGSHRFLHEQINSAQETEKLHQLILSLEDSGHSVVAVGQEDKLHGLLTIADQLRPESTAVTQQLNHLGLTTILLTGDNQGTADAIASDCAFNEVHAELLPADKMQQIDQLQKKYGPIAMVGDGVNDAPALASANLGIAMGALGSDAAIETADIALMTDSITKLPWLISHSKRVLRTIKANISFALGLKAVFIALAFAKLATLWMAIAADTGASLIVIFNSLRLLHDRSSRKT